MKTDRTIISDYTRRRSNNILIHTNKRQLLQQNNNKKPRTYRPLYSKTDFDILKNTFHGAFLSPTKTEKYQFLSISGPFKFYYRHIDVFSFNFGPPRPPQPHPKFYISIVEVDYHLITCRFDKKMNSYKCNLIFDL